MENATEEVNVWYNGILKYLFIYFIYIADAASTHNDDNMSVTSSVARRNKLTPWNKNYEWKNGRNRDMTDFDLPPIEHLRITVEEKVELKKLGIVTSIVDTLCKCCVLRSLIECFTNVLFMFSDYPK
jgi:hypothetical protein